MSDMTALFMRVCEMNIGGRLLTTPPMTLEFEYEFSVQGITNTKAKIYNPAPATVSAAKKDAIVTISAGYADDSGSVFTGVIAKPLYTPGRDSILELTLEDKSERFATSVINRAWKGPITAKQVAQDIISLVGITGSKIVPANNITYERGIAFPGTTVRAALTRLAQDTGSQLFFRQGQCYMIADTKGVAVAWELSSSTGLLSATKTDTGYKIQSLFLYRLGVGSLVTLKRKDTQTLLRVSKGKHTFSPKGTTATEFEAVRL